MARFLGGLNIEIANMVELHHYVDLEDMLHITIKVEWQLNKKSISRFVTRVTSTWRGKWVPNEKRDGGLTSLEAISVDALISLGPNLVPRVKRL